MSKIQVDLEIDGERVGAGVFEVLPRVGESVYVQVHSPEGGRTIEGIVRSVGHGSSVTIDENGNLTSSSTVGLVLSEAIVNPLEAACTSDD